MVCLGVVEKINSPVKLSPGARPITGVFQGDNSIVLENHAGFPGALLPMASTLFPIASLGPAQNQSN